MSVSISVRLPEFTARQLDALAKRTNLSKTDSYVLRSQGSGVHLLDETQTPTSYPTFLKPNESSIEGAHWRFIQEISL